MLLIKFVQNDQHLSLSTCRYQHLVWQHSEAAACGAVLAQSERQDQAAERQGLLILWQGTGPIIATNSNIKNNHNE
jgi:hypothetical protein